MIILIIIPFLVSLLQAEMVCHYPEEKMMRLFPESDSLIISDRPIARGSVSVTRHGLLLVREDDYRVDYDRCLLFVLFSHPEAETLQVRYERSSFDFRPGYFHRRRTAFLESPDSIRVETSAFLSPPDDRAEEAALFLAGSKTIGVTVASGNALSIDQSLNLNIRGEIAKDVQIRAVLTDQNMPFQPEGNTESIRELDQVLVEIESPRLKGALGDLILSQDSTRFGNFRKKIKGGEAEYHDKKYRAATTLAVSQALFNVMEFDGQEENQGPYRLKSRGGAAGIIVLAGTERVTVQGKLKKRGQNNDYVIEYGNGQITFTPGCLITADSRIVVEYEYAENEYPKNIVSAGGGADLADGRLRVALSYLGETDDEGHPLRAPLSRTDRDGLALAGDTGIARGSGVFAIPRDSVNAYRGFYVLSAEPSFPDPHFVYHPPRDSALFRGVPFFDVEFLYRGPGSGDYRLETIADSTDPELTGTFAPTRQIYVYQGKGLGEYLPGHALARPESRRLGTLRYNARPLAGMTFQGELTGSDYDRNTLSSRDDNDNQGVAAENGFSVTLGKYLKEEGPGRFTLSAHQELIQKNFAPFLPVQNTYDFGRKWNLTLPGVALSLKSIEGRLDYSPEPAWNLAGGGGALDLDRGTSRRGMGELRYNAQGRRSFSLAQEYAGAETEDTSRNLWRTSGAAGLLIGKLTPGLNYTGEFKADQTPAKLLRKSNYQEMGANLLYGRFGALSGESGLSARLDRVSRGAAPETLGDSARAYTISNRFSLDGPGSLSMDLNLVDRRSSRLENNAWNKYRSDLVNFTADARPLDGALDERFRYDLSSALSQTVVDRYEAVPAGTGTHVRDAQTGDYIPRAGGDYIFSGTIADQNSASQNINKSELSLRLFFYPGRLKRLANDSGFLKDLNFDTYLLAGQDKFSDAYSGKGFHFYDPFLPDFNPGNVSAKRSSRYELNFKEDISLDARDRRLFLRFRIYPRYRFNYQHTLDGFAGKDEWQNAFYSLLTRFSPLASVQFEDELVTEWVLRFRDGPDPLYDVYNRRSINTITYSLNRAVSFPMGFTAGLSVNNRPAPVRAPYLILKPGVTYVLPGRGKIDGSYEHVRVFTDKPDLIYEMAEGNLPGTTHRAELSAMFTLGKNMDMDFFYTLEKNEHAPRAVQRGTAELKAYF